MSLNMFYYQERSRKAVDLKYCAVFTHSAQFRGFIWPLFLKYNMSMFTFWGWTIDFLGNICPQTCCITKKGSKMQLDFEYCAVWTYSAQFRWLVWPFFGIITCLRSIFRSFWGWSFDFWRDIWHLICCIANKWSKIAEFIPQLGASAKYF